MKEIRRITVTIYTICRLLIILFFADNPECSAFNVKGTAFNDTRLSIYV